MSIDIPDFVWGDKVEFKKLPGTTYTILKETRIIDNQRQYLITPIHGRDVWAYEEWLQKVNCYSLSI